MQRQQRPDTPEAKAAREQYASRWLEIAHGVEPIPMDHPMGRKPILDALFRAGAAEFDEVRHA